MRRMGTRLVIGRMPDSGSAYNNYFRVQRDQLPAAEFELTTAGRITETANITKRVSYLVRDEVSASLNPNMKSMIPSKSFHAIPSAIARS